MASIRDLLNRSREELLDLSTRNRLLSIPKSKSARVVRVQDEFSEEVFRHLVVEKKALSFLPGKDTETTNDQLTLAGEGAPSEGDVGLPQPEEDESAEGPSHRHTALRLQTALSPEGLQRRLLALYRDARTMVEEQGVNILYLALGQLKWHEVDRSDTPLYAPLVLIPVELQRKTASERFYVRWLEEDIQENLSLQAKLRVDFGIELPPFSADEDFSPTDYFGEVAKAIGDAKSKGWEVLPDAISLGFFSFAKFLMYRDLDPENWPDGELLVSHPLIAGLLVNGFPPSEPLWANAADLDQLIPAARLDHVVDADSSQTVAIEMVRQGRNLVIQGPPGTGKSQSITNIIAAAVLDGKKVLFVAEKLAALQVVKRRLEHEGLGPACLELHSNKAKKRTVIEEIGRTWQLGRPTGTRLDAVVAQLEQSRNALNKHVALLHEHAGPCGLSPFAVVGRLVALGERGRGTGSLTFVGAENWTVDERDERRRLVEELAAVVWEIGVPTKHPWRGVGRETVLNIDLDPLVTHIRTVVARLTELQERSPDLASTIQRPTPKTFSESQEQQNVAGTPTVDLSSQDPWCGVGHKSILKSDLDALVAQVRSLIARLSEMRQTSANIAAEIHQRHPPTFSETDEQRIIAGFVAEAPKLDKEALTSEVWDKHLDVLRIAVVEGQRYATAVREVGTRVSESAWSEDFTEVRTLLTRHGRSLLRCFSGGYRRALARLRSVMHVELPKSYAERLALVDQIVNGQIALHALSVAEPHARIALGKVWQRELTDWEQAERVVVWVEQQRELGLEIAFRRLFVSVEDQTRVARLVEELTARLNAARSEAEHMAEQLALDWSASFGAANLDIVPLTALADRCQAWLIALESLSKWSREVARLKEELVPRYITAHREVEVLIRELNLDCVEAFGVTDFEHVAFDVLTERCQTWQTETESLSKWSNYFAQARRACELALGPLVEQLKSGALLSDNAVACFDRVYHEQMLRWFIQRNPELARFNGLRHEAKIAEFRKLDSERLKLAKHRTMAAHFQGMPPCTAGVGGTGIVRAEMERQRGHRSIRRLLKEAGSVVQAIKPVFMMSPLSVAQFIEPGAVEFDLLVIDEASQVQPVDALGAIARCKQIIVVGDSKQLPPTRFFARLTSDSDEDDEMNEEVMPAQAQDMESILGLCAARGLPQTMLGWHYRSRHHSLIAVSNHEFYDDRLFIVPSPCTTSPELGLRFHYVPDGVFDRGASATNRTEAKAVCHAVIEHARSTPEASLGVAAFSIRQQQAILDELELLRREYADTEPFFHSHADEPFFVKNLESVQGDERDVVFISVGYGRDANGYLAMSFGPLSHEGGERRLNVLITRAKNRCEVFTSITADDIDLARVNGRGVRALKTFLTYAQNGRLDVVSPAGGEEQSPFEEAVGRAVESLGYRVDTQVGVAGFFVDLAVVDPEQEGRYLLGIECDGATYHSSRSARDRDRLRQAVLEDHGWVIHRIWSTDWFQRPTEQLRKVGEAVELAKRKQSIVARTPKNTAEQDGPSDTIRRELAPRFSEDGLQAMAIRYCEARFPVSTRHPPDELPVEDMCGIVMRIVKEESPVHEDEVVVRVRDLWGFGRAGSRIQEAVAKAVRRLVTSRRCCRDRGFLSIEGELIAVRNRENVRSPSLRKPEMLPPAEIQAAILALLTAHHGATREEIPTAVARIFGFRATSSALRETILGQLTALRKSGAVELHNGLLKSKSQNCGG
jgi:very-short-patch-repair endonuclease